jgi:hypothetical protein
MNDNSHPAERSPVEFFMFGLGFVGFIIATTGIILGFVPGAVTGALILVAAVAFFNLCGSQGD